MWPRQSNVRVATVGAFIVFSYWVVMRRQPSQSAGYLDFRSDVTPHPGEVRTCSSKERSLFIKQMCKQYVNSLPEPSREPEFLVDDVRRIAFCYIQKCGSTTMKDLIIKSAPVTGNKTGKIRMHTRNDEELSSRNLRILNLSDFQQIEKYSKILIVRNPMDRLVSAYRDKFIYSGEKNYAKYKTYMQDKFMSRDRDSNPEFWMFVELLFEGYDDRHWGRFANMCLPCEISYDHVFRVESLRGELNVLQGVLNIERDLQQKHRKEHRIVENETKCGDETLTCQRHLPEYYHVSAGRTDFLLNMFKVEMDMFGYHFDKTTKTASCSIETDSGFCC